MKTVIQNNETSLFLKPSGEWGDSVAGARDFESAVQALYYCQEHRLRNVQILLSFGAKEYDLTLAVQDTATPVSRRSHQAEPTVFRAETLRN